MTAADLALRQIPSKFAINTKMTSIIKTDTPANLNVQTGGVLAIEKLVAFAEPEDETVRHLYPNDPRLTELLTYRITLAYFRDHENISSSLAERADKTENDILKIG